MLLTFLISLAFADLAPPPGFVETCTVANHSSDTAKCVACRASFQGRASCEALEAQGYRQACRTGGASVWTEVMCVAATEGEAPARPEPVAGEPVTDRPAEPPAPDGATAAARGEPATDAGRAPPAQGDATGRCSHFSATPILLFALALALVRRRGPARGPVDRALRWLLPIAALGASFLPLSDIAPGGGCRCSAAPAVDLAPPGGGCRCDSGASDR